MKVTYNSILNIFVRNYPLLNKYNINEALLSIVDPKYRRLSDNDFTTEQLYAKRNIPGELVKSSMIINFKDALNNVILINKFFKKQKTNDKIKYILLKLIDLDESYELENSPMYDEGCYLSNKFPRNLNFNELVVNTVLYACRYGKTKINKSITTEELEALESYGINDSPYLFLENDKKYLSKYSKYYNSAVENISQLKTILYKNEAISFYDIYVAPDVTTEVNKFRDSTYLECKGGALSTENYIKIFGKYTSIIAPGGFGKSMLLKHLFLSNTVLKKEMQAKIIPIFIQVRSFNSSRISIEDMLYKEISKYCSVKKDQFLHDLKQGNFLLLFDGLDELKSTDAEYFFDELNTLTEIYSHNYFVTSSRPSEQAKCLTKFKLLKLHGFSTERATKMIKKLPNIKDEIKDEFCAKLSNGEFRKNLQIASNPLLLTLMFMVFIIKGKLPTKTYKFYEDAFSVLFYEHDEVKGFKNRKYYTGMKRIQFSKVLSEFCFISMGEQHYSFSEFEFDSILNQTSYKDKVSTDDFLLDLTDNLNLLYLEGGKYHFVHRSFQEYFAAYYCNLMNDNDYSKLPNWYNSLKVPNIDIKSINLYPNGLGIFTFMYDMNTERIMRLILKPYLSTFIQNTGDELKDYLYFLDSAYLFIEYGFQQVNAPRQQLFKIIMEVLDFDYYAEITGDTPSYEEYISESLYCIDCGDHMDVWNYWEVENYIDRNKHISREECLKQLDIDLSKPYDYNYRIPIKDIIENISDFSKLIPLLIDEKSHLYKNYKKVLRLLS